MESIKRYITKRKKRFIVISLFLLLLLINAVARPTRIIPIPGGQEYAGGTFDEYYVVINPPIAPWGAYSLQRLIINYDKTHPIAAPAPPEDTEYIWGYTRQFFRESETFPKDIEFTVDFGPRNILTEEYNLKDRIVYISAGIDEITYDIMLPWGEIIPIGPWRDDPLWTVDLECEEENTDLTLNGLYNNVPEHMIPKHSKGYEHVIGG